MLIRSAVPTDLKAIENLLASFGLTTAGLSPQLEGFLIAEDGPEIVASAGTEIYGSSALLRSVAVRRDYQRRGLARQLVERLLARARQKGVQRVYLLTTTAAGYFRQLGFRPIFREDVDEAVRGSSEFCDAVCESAAVMRHVLSGLEGEPP